MSTPSFDINWNSEDIDTALHSFEAIQEELNYKQAQNSLRDIVNKIDLTPQEKTGLELDLDRLADKS